MDSIRIPNELFFEEVRDILASGRSVTITATGRSMTPTFRNAVDKVTISSCEFETVEKGDVVLFDRGDTICLHRVISRDCSRLVIRGDGNSPSSLEYATADKVIGKVTGGTMRGGHPFTSDDERWKSNTRFILKHHRCVFSFYRILGLVKSYPFSLLALLLLFFLSFFNPGNRELPKFENSDKLAHLIMYCGLSFVFWFEWLVRHKTGRSTVLRGMAFCFFVPLAIGGLIELGQEYLVSYRDGDWMDVLANIAGCILALVLTYLVSSPLIRRFKLR